MSRSVSGRTVVACATPRRNSELAAIGRVVKMLLKRMQCGPRSILNTLQQNQRALEQEPITSFPLSGLDSSPQDQQKYTDQDTVLT
jgi:hypothetical protein